jgi:hypothetical protein
MIYAAPFIIAAGSRRTKFVSTIMRAMTSTTQPMTPQETRIARGRRGMETVVKAASYIWS